MSTVMEGEGPKGSKTEITIPEGPVIPKHTSEATGKPESTPYLEQKLTPPPSNNIPQCTPPPSNNIPQCTPSLSNNIPQCSPPSSNNIPQCTPPPSNHIPQCTPQPSNNIPQYTNGISSGTLGTGAYHSASWNDFVNSTMYPGNTTMYPGNTAMYPGSTTMYPGNPTMPQQPDVRNAAQQPLHEKHNDVYNGVQNGSSSNGVHKSRSYPIPQKVAIATLFGSIVEDNVTFCIDTSGSMYNCLDAIKEHLIETLIHKAHQSQDCKFNLIEFTSEVMLWSDKMVHCSPQTVSVAAEWISRLEAKTGSNMLQALVSAFSDDECHAVVLVTDGNPDQNPTDILDYAVYAAQNRPVHCYYIQDNVSDQVSLEFLQDLAMETFGSLHVVTVTQHGSIERVTPVYRAEMSAERVIRTTDGMVYPSNHKVCRTTATVDTPATVVVDQPYLYPLDPLYPLSPYWWYPWPTQYHLAYPHTGWSRYRVAKGWSKFTHGLTEDAEMGPLVQGAGAFLIDKVVLARRKEDGLYYKARVKSQIVGNKFLVEFGPVKHGKYQKTVYQETFIYDLISYDDGMRHAILTNDKVLAPWEPEGERYAPGVVLQGQEKRSAEGGGPDSSLVISFFNGKSATLPKDTAMWIPPKLQERITFEVNLPTAVRKDFTTDECYPKETKPGYPSSGPKPKDFAKFDPAFVVRPDPFIPYEADHSPFYMPLYPIYYKYQARPSYIRSDEADHLVPGTELTKFQLNDRVTRQLQEYGTQHSRPKLLNKRGLEKSVTFEENKKAEVPVKPAPAPEKSAEQEDILSDIEAEYYSGDLDLHDSGHCSEVEEGEGKKFKEVGVGTNVDQSYSRRRVRPRSSGDRPMWRYWGNDPAPSLTEPLHYGPYREGPYDDVVAAAPMELRNHRVSQYGLEWANSVSGYVDPLAPNRPMSSVADCMNHWPRPPPVKVDKQGPGVEIGLKLGQSQSNMDRMKEAQLQYKRRVVLQRRQDWEKRKDDQYNSELAMKEQHKQQNISRLMYARNKHQEESEKIQRQLNAKRQTNNELRLYWEGQKAQQLSRDHGHLEALRARRIRREEFIKDQQHERTDQERFSQAVKASRVQFRNDEYTQKMAANDSRDYAVGAAKHKTHIKRLEHFRRMEENGQRMQELRAHVRNQAGILFEQV